jgi:hypothetical protein
MTFIIVKIVDALVGVRVSAEDELTGLDLTQHAENAYAIGGSVVGEHVAPTRSHHSQFAETAPLRGAVGKG